MTMNRYRFGFGAVVVAVFVLGFVIDGSGMLRGAGSSRILAAEPQPLDAVSLNDRAMQIITGICGQCHSSDDKLRTQPAYAKGPAHDQELGDIEKMIAEPTLDLTYPIVPGDPDQSEIIHQVTKPRNGMPEPPLPPLTTEQIETLKSWIACMPKDYAGDSPLTACAAAGEAPATPGVAQATRFVSITGTLAAIAGDLAQLPEVRRGDARYVTLANQFNAGASDSDMTVYRAGLARGLNSLSSKANMAPLVAIDADRTVYRFFLADLGWSSADWDALMQEYPYAGLPFEDVMTTPPQGTDQVVDRIVGLLGRPEATTLDVDAAYRAAQIFTRGDWLVRVVTHPGRYEKLLRLPQTLDGLEKDRLQVDPVRDILIEADGVVRGGFPANGRPHESGVSDYSRIIERHPLDLLPGGYFWKSFDFGPANSGRTAIPEHPLQVSELDSSDARLGFIHDGGEMIFSLPNGLQAYLITTVKGNVLPSAPNNIVNLDNDGFSNGALPVRMWEYQVAKLFKNPETNQVLVATDIDIFNGLSCMACHFKGMKTNTDTVGQYFADIVTSGTPNTYTLKDIERIRSLYNDNRLQDSFEKDSRHFALAVIAAYAAIGLSPSDPGWDRLVSPAGDLLADEPVTQLARQYATDLSAGTPEQVQRRTGAEFWMDGATYARAAHASSNPANAQLFGRLAETLNVVKREDGNVNQPDVIGEGPFECQFHLFAEELRWAALNDTLVSGLNNNADICAPGTAPTPPPAAPSALELSLDVLHNADTLEIKARVAATCGPLFLDFAPNRRATPLPDILFGPGVAEGSNRVFDTRSSDKRIKVSADDERGTHQVGFICTGGVSYADERLNGLLRQVERLLRAGTLKGKLMDGQEFEFTTYRIE